LPAPSASRNQQHGAMRLSLEVPAIRRQRTLPLSLRALLSHLPSPPLGPLPLSKVSARRRELRDSPPYAPPAFGIRRQSQHTADRGTIPSPKAAPLAHRRTHPHACVGAA